MKRLISFLLQAVGGTMGQTDDNRMLAAFALLVGVSAEKCCPDSSDSSDLFASVRAIPVQKFNVIYFMSWLWLITAMRQRKRLAGPAVKMGYKNIKHLLFKKRWHRPGSGSRLVPGAWAGAWAWAWTCSHFIVDLCNWLAPSLKIDANMKMPPND